MAEYRLVWFQHLHKVAGTTIVELASVNGEKLYPDHNNGNPQDSNGKMIELWKMDGEELIGFVDECEKKRITFIATEWGSPDFRQLAEDPRVNLITCIRDPLKRYLSNFKYDIFKSFTDKKNIYEYLNSTDVSAVNYYTMVFSRNNFDIVKKIGLSLSDLEIAKDNLSLFDMVVDIENRGSLNRLRGQLGWNQERREAVSSSSGTPIMVKIISMLTGWEDDPLKKKKTMDNPYLAVEILKRFDLPLFMKYLNPSKMEPDDEFIDHFREKNKLDFLFYNYAKSMAL
jgi:hypothetical protein